MLMRREVIRTESIDMIKGGGVTDESKVFKKAEDDMTQISGDAKY